MGEERKGWSGVGVGEERKGSGVGVGGGEEGMEWCGGGGGMERCGGWGMEWCGSGEEMKGWSGVGVWERGGRRQNGRVGRWLEMWYRDEGVFFCLENMPSASVRSSGQLVGLFNLVTG